MKPEFKIEKQPNCSSLIVCGDLIVQFSNQFKSHLQVLGAEDASLELSLTKVTAIDVSALQLIHAFKKVIKTNQRKLNLISPENKEINGLLEKTGLTKIMSAEE